MFRAALIWLGLLAALSLWPTSLAAQRLEVRWPSPIPNSPRTWIQSATADSGWCFDCDPRRKFFWTGSAQLIGAMLVPWAFNEYGTESDFADVNPGTWWDNLTGDWVYDDNSFITNQFAHPYHGSLYFNAFRTNGYNFWESAIASWTGAFMWEAFGETNPPAPNDLLNTAIGGISLGEMLWRTSSTVLDNNATGAERVFREIGAGLINPQRGVSRLVHGYSNDVAPNGPEHSPVWTGGALDLGYQSIDGVGATDTSTAGGMIRFDYRYGDPVADLTGRPFSTFAFELNILTGGATPGIEEAFTHGSLAGRRIGDPEGANRHALGVMLNYDYSNNPAYEVGMQSLTGGFFSDWRLSSRAIIHTEALARGIIISGIKSPEYIVVGEGRDYDYGPGIGARLDATLQLHRIGSLRAGYESNWTTTMNGTDGSHGLDRFLVRARVELLPWLGLGAGYKWRRIRSWYSAYPTENEEISELRFFISTAVPRWNY